MLITHTHIRAFTAFHVYAFTYQDYYDNSSSGFLLCKSAGGA